MENEKITITTEKGTYTCVCLAIISDDSNEYVVLLPCDENGKSLDDVFIYQLIQSNEKDKEYLTDIEDPDVFKELYQQFLTLCSTPGFDQAK